MKKKILLLLVLVPALMLVLTGCEKKTENTKKDDRKTIELSDEKLGFKTTFKYDKKENYSDIKQETGGASNSITFKNEDLDVKFEMYYNKMRKATYNSSKDTRSKQKYYKEYKLGKYEAYAYGEYDDGLYLNIILDTEDEDVDVLFVSIDRIDNNKEVIISDVFVDKKLQDLFKTINFEHIK